MSNTIDWEEYFMLLAIMTSRRSKDPKTQVGAVISDGENKVLSVGYNGFPKTMNDNNDAIYSWTKGEKDLFVIHAEENCILNGNTQLYDNSTMYCTLFPCNKCSQSIVQSGIKTIIYMDEKPDSEIFQASRKILENANVSVIRYKKRGKQLTINF